MYFNSLEEERKEEQMQDQGQNQNKDRLQLLKERVSSLLQTSEDADFTAYLRQLQTRLANQEQQLEDLTEELDRQAGIHERKLQAAPREVQTPPEVQQAAPREVQTPPEVQQAAPREVQMPPEVQQAAPREVQTPSEVQQAAPQEVQTPPEVQQAAPREVQTPPEAYQAAPRQGQIPPMGARPVQKKRSVEFTVGIAVLSITGAAFILTAMVLLGMYFMEGLTKGLMLYAVCIVVMLLSELLLYRRWPGLGMTLSAIGMGGLYISTLINYLVLHNFHQLVALGLTLLITLVVLLLGRKRDAAAYRILGMTATYVCILLVPDSEAVGGGLSLTEFVTAAVMAFLVNIMCLAVPVRKAHTGIHVTHMALNTAFTFIAYFRWVYGMSGSAGALDEMWRQQIWQRPLFLAVSILIMQMIFVVQIRWQERQRPDGSMADNVGICVTYGVSALVYTLLVFLSTDFTYAVSWIELSGDPYVVNRLVCSGAVAALCLVPMLILRKKQEKWFIWYLMNLLVAAIHLGNGGDWESSICLLVLLMASKLLSFTKRPMLYSSDAVVTTLACLTVLLCSDYNYAIPLVVGLVLSVLCLNYWHSYFEVILAFTLAAYTASHMLSTLKLPVFVGILFVAMLLFNNVKRWRGKGMGILVFNALALSGQAFAYLLLVNPVYRNAYLTYLCMLVFGVATIMICFQKQYYLDFSCKQLVLAVFLTYMGLIVRTSYPIVNSILLMVIALFCVGMGFIIKKKSVRIYGLVLSLVICGKLVLYDFMGANILQKTILFFAVGVLALIIAAIYMILEHTYDKKSLPRQDEEGK